jgi:hypothetical protein
MEIPTDQQIIQWYFECLFTDNFIDTLNPYQIEKVYIYAMDYEYNLKPTTRERFENFTTTGKWLPENPMKENVKALTIALKEKQKKIHIDDKINIIDDRIVKDKETFTLLENEANNIENLSDKIKFWLDKQLEFERNITLETLTVSGMTSKETGLNQKFFLDRLIDAELIRLKGIMELNSPEEELNDFELKEDQEKILFLDNIGVIEFLRKKYSITSNGHMGEILKPITGVKPATIARTLSRIHNKELPEKSMKNVNSLKDKLKIGR